MLSFPLSAAAILIAMMQHCEEFLIDTSQIRSCGCDATNVNTARHNGSIALLEKNLGQELQRFMCCLHASQDRAAIQTHIHCIWWRDFWPQLVHRRYQKSSQDNRSVNEEFPSSPETFKPLNEDTVKKLVREQRVLHRLAAAVITCEFPSIEVLSWHIGFTNPLKCIDNSICGLNYIYIQYITISIHYNLHCKYET